MKVSCRIWSARRATLEPVLMGHLFQVNDEMQDLLDRDEALRLVRAFLWNSVDDVTDVPLERDDLMALVAEFDVYACGWLTARSTYWIGLRP